MIHYLINTLKLHILIHLYQLLVLLMLHLNSFQFFLHLFLEVDYLLNILLPLSVPCISVC